MSLTPISSLESAWKNFLMNSTYKSNVFGLRRPKWVKQSIARPNRPEENFSWTRRTSCLESRKQTFLGQEAEMSLIPIKSLESAKENFSWTGRTWCLESRNETFLGSGGRNESNTHQFARIGLKKFSHEFDVQINVFGLRRPKWVKQPIARPNNREKKFFMNSTYIMSRNEESNVFGLRRPKWV